MDAEGRNRNDRMPRNVVASVVETFGERKMTTLVEKCCNRINIYLYTSYDEANSKDSPLHLPNILLTLDSGLVNVERLGLC